MCANPAVMVSCQVQFDQIDLSEIIEFVFTQNGKVKGMERYKTSSTFKKNIDPLSIHKGIVMSL